jgi:hypothetical protein
LLKSGFNLSPTLVKLVILDKFKYTLFYSLFIPNTLQREPKSNCLFIYLFFIFIQPTYRNIWIPSSYLDIHLPPRYHTNPNSKIAANGYILQTTIQNHDLLQQYTVQHQHNPRLNPLIPLLLLQPTLFKLIDIFKFKLWTSLHHHRMMIQSLHNSNQ